MFPSVMLATSQIPSFRTLLLTHAADGQIHCNSADSSVTNPGSPGSRVCSWCSGMGLENAGTSYLSCWGIGNFFISDRGNLTEIDQVVVSEGLWSVKEKFTMQRLTHLGGSGSTVLRSELETSIIFKLRSLVTPFLQPGPAFPKVPQNPRTVPGD